MNLYQNKLDAVGTLIEQLVSYCDNNNWAGYDPFDGLNSRIYKVLPLKNSRLVKLVVIQSMKRSPVNFRPLFLVPKERNPKGLALFISALCTLSKLGIYKKNNVISDLIGNMIDMCTQNRPNACWGYNFDWQNRYNFIPKFSPNIICTTFAGNALLDAYDLYGISDYLELAKSAGQFILDDLNTTKRGDTICFSYTTLDTGRVHNANMLGGAFLARLYSATKNDHLFTMAKKSLQFSVNAQLEDGSWLYGEYDKQNWIDNFHTGYNLSALHNFRKYTGYNDFDENIRKGFTYYVNNFFTSEGIAKYFNNQVYPIDIHSIAQSVISLVELREFNDKSTDLADKVLNWAAENMRDKKGYFYYQITPLFKNKISYIRWSQGWMLYAMSIYAKHLSSQ